MKRVLHEDGWTGDVLMVHPDNSRLIKVRPDKGARWRNGKPVARRAEYHLAIKFTPAKEKR